MIFFNIEPEKAMTEFGIESTGAIYNKTLQIIDHINDTVLMGTTIGVFEEAIVYLIKALTINTNKKHFRWLINTLKR
jgi:uncharacterized membrane protein SirB2